MRHISNKIKIRCHYDNRRRNPHKAASGFILKSDLVRPPKCDIYALARLPSSSVLFSESQNKVSLLRYALF